MSAFTAFTYRDGYPRRIPDKGTYWHLGKEVKTLPKRMRHHQHPELAGPKPVKGPSKGERAERQGRAVEEGKQKKYRSKWSASERGYPSKRWLQTFRSAPLGRAKALQLRCEVGPGLKPCSYGARSGQG